MYDWLRNAARALNFPFNFYLAASRRPGHHRSPCRYGALVPRTGHVDAPGDRKIHDASVPLAGGLAVLTGVCCPWWRRVLLKLGVAMHGRRVQSCMASTGRRRRTGGDRPLGAVAIPGGLAGRQNRTESAGQIRRPISHRPGGGPGGKRITLFVPNLLFSYAITILWLVTVINAFNFMDNMNGLCAGLGAIGALLFG